MDLEEFVPRQIAEVRRHQDVHLGIWLLHRAFENDPEDPRFPNWYAHTDTKQVCTECAVDWPCETVRILAFAYNDSTDYNLDWLPKRGLVRGVEAPDPSPKFGHAGDAEF